MKHARGFLAIAKNLCKSNATSMAVENVARRFGGVVLRRFPSRLGPAAASFHSTPQEWQHGGVETRSGREVQEATIERMLSPDAGGDSLTSAEFAQASDTVMDDIAAASIEGTAPVEVTREPNALHIRMPENDVVISIERDVEARQLLMRALTGTFTYSFNPVTKEWRCNHAGDTHALLDLLLRDLTTMARGQAGKRY